MTDIVPVKRITDKKNLLRGKKVLMDRDLAQLYGVETRVLIQGVKRNIERFPSEFTFQLTQDEFDSLRSQIVISKGKGGRRYLPYAFTEQGVAMLSSVLRSKRAIKGDRQIMLDKPYCVKYAGEQVLIFYLAKKRRRMTCPG